MENLTTQLGELFSAIQRSDIPQVRRLLSAQVSPNQCNAEGKTALMVASSIGNPTIIQMLCTAAATHKPPEYIFFKSGITAPTHHTHTTSTLLSPELDSYPPAAVLANAAQPSKADYLAILSQPKPALPLPDYTATLSTLTDRTLIDSVRHSTAIERQVERQVEQQAEQAPALLAEQPGTIVEASATTASKTPKAIAEGLIGLATKGLRSLTGKRRQAPQSPLQPTPIHSTPLHSPSSQATPPAAQTASPSYQRAIEILPIEIPSVETVTLASTPIDATPTTSTTTPSTTTPSTTTPSTPLSSQQTAPERIGPEKTGPEKTVPAESNAPDIEELALDALLHGNISQLPELDQHASHQPPNAKDGPDDLEFTDAFADIESIIRPGQQRPVNRQNLPTLRTPIPISKTSTPEITSDDLDTHFLAQTPHIAVPTTNNNNRHATPSNPDANPDAHPDANPKANPGQTHPEEAETDGQTPLEIAVKRNDVEAVVSLLKAGVDFRPAAWYDTPVLVTAAALGHGEIAQILINKGANVNNGYDHLPLHSAAANGHLGVTQMLLNAGAYIHGREENGRTALIVAAANGHLPVVQMLMERGADIHMVSQGETALTIAAKNGHQAVHNYLQSGRLPQSPSWKQGQGQTQNKTQGLSRYEAELQAIQGNPENAPPLPAPPGARPGPDPADITAAESRQKLIETLMYAAADGHLPRLRQALADGADVNGLGDDWGSGLIHTLASDGNSDPTGAPTDTPGTERRTALSVAIQAGHISLIEALLDANADPNQPDQTAAGIPTLYPIIAAACSSSAIHRSDIIRLLLLQGAAINQTDDRGRSALMHAIAAQHLDAIATLIAENADLNITDIADRSALNYAQATGQPQIIQRLEQAIQQQQQAIELLTAVTQENPDEVQVLLTSGVNPNAIAEGMSALDQAAAKGYVAIAQQLISAGADINGRATPSELNPLLYAAYRGQIEMVKLLISVGADLHAKVDNQYNALSYAHLGQQQKRNAGKPFGELIHLLKTQGLKQPNPSTSQKRR